MSQEVQKDHQGHQPPEPLPVHTATIQKARSVQVHQSWDRETEKQLLSQGHQTAKQPSLTQRLLPTLATLINGSLVTLYNATQNNVTLIMFTYLTLLISHENTVFYTICCTLSMPLSHRASIYLYVHFLIHPFRCVY
jgi:hypothetical protein